MKTPEELNAYFKTGLSKEINALEEQRLAILGQYSFKPYKRILLMAVVLIVMLFIVSSMIDDPRLVWFTALIPLTAVFAIVYPLVIWFKRARKFDSVNRAYKATLLPPLIHFFDPSMNYRPGEGISRKEFETSELFRSEFIRSYVSEDLVTWQRDKAEVRIADVRAQKPHQGSGKGSRDSMTLFSGLLMTIGLPFSVTTPVIVKIDPSQSLVAKAGKALLGGVVEKIAEKIESMNLAGDRVKIAHGEFEKFFTVNSGDAKEAVRMLTPAVCDLFIKYTAASGNAMEYSFVGQKLHVALPAPDFLEGESHTSFKDFDGYREYFRYLSVADAFVIEFGAALSR